MTSPMFEDRKDAGTQLAQALEKYKDKHPLILAIPRGGVEVGYQVASHLKADFSILISRKLPFPNNTESGFGAIAEDGSTYLNDFATEWISQAEKQTVIEEQRKEIARRIKVLRNDKPLPSITKRIVILVDDGIAMGSTMRAAILLCEKKKAEKIIVAAPVAGAMIVQDLRKLVDEVVVLEIPKFFHAVAQVYRHWYDVSDAEVLTFLRQAD